MPRLIPAWRGGERPTATEFKNLCMDASDACSRASRVFNIEENGDFKRSQRLMIEDLIHTIEQVIDVSQDLNSAITICLSDALPIDDVVDAEVEGPF
ncbi:MAG: hypothetical protein M1337_02355 [Actinobacteria bacterium]|nr:hypothetical protein [Actinomycetota bacterium]